MTEVTFDRLQQGKKGLGNYWLRNQNGKNGEENTNARSNQEV